LLETNKIVRPVVAQVDLTAIRDNVAFLKGLAPDGCFFMAVVKANAYGHGDIEVSRAALSAGADCLGVAILEEAEKLRSAGFDCPIQLLFEPPPSAASRVLAADVTCTVYTPEMARALDAAAQEESKQARVHLKVDTGMRRVGIRPEDSREFADLLKSLEGLRVEGVYTHFAVATEPQDPFTESQMDLFESAASVVEGVMGKTLIRHAANSAGVMAFPRSHYDMVRVGIAMYGLPPSPRFAGVRNLRPALSLTGEVGFVKRVDAGEGISYGLEYAPSQPTFVATLPLGYGDGMSRILTGRSDVLVGGQRRPVIGVICMDTCMIDLGPEPVPRGTPFTVIGRDGAEEITADDVAGRLGTINYEVCCMIGPRVPRVYIDD